MTLSNAPLTGTIKRLVRDKGFGFLATDHGDEYFFHRSAFADFDHLEEGERVRFQPGDEKKGPRAEQMERLSATPPPPPPGVDRPMTDILRTLVQLRDKHDAFEREIRALTEEIRALRTLLDGSLDEPLQRHA